MSCPNVIWWKVKSSMHFIWIGHSVRWQHGNYLNCCWPEGHSCACDASCGCSKTKGPIRITRILFSQFLRELFLIRTNYLFATWFALQGLMCHFKQFCRWAYVQYDGIATERLISLKYFTMSLFRTLMLKLRTTVNKTTIKTTTKLSRAIIQKLMWKWYSMFPVLCILVHTGIKFTVTLIFLLKF